MNTDGEKNPGSPCYLDQRIFYIYLMDHDKFDFESDE